MTQNDVKAVGQPVLEYAASIYQTRTALVSFEDGLSVLATFEYQDGQYVQTTMMWHSGAIFYESAFNEINDDLMLVRMHGFKTGHEVGSIQIEDDGNRIEEVKLTPKKPTIIYYKKYRITALNSRINRKKQRKNRPSTIHPAPQPKLTPHHKCFQQRQSLTNFRF